MNRSATNQKDGCTGQIHLTLKSFVPIRGARIELWRELGIAPGAMVIGLVARFNPMKDHSNFVAAGTAVDDYRADLHFVLVGRKIDTNNELLM
jgi:glycosyltransferase involved in cell wall biosynthesis